MRTTDGSIQIDGGWPLGPAVYEIHADRIVTGTYLLALCAAGGRVCIGNAPVKALTSLLPVLEQMGAEVTGDGSGLAVSMQNRPQAVPLIVTGPYPGFPTDLQSPLMAALCRAGKDSMICEKIFEKRFGIVKELRRMGAVIQTDGSYAVIHGVQNLQPAELRTPDLRGGAALAIAALQAEGTSRILQAEYIRRGYEDMAADLRKLGVSARSGEIPTLYNKRTGEIE